MPKLDYNNIQPPFYQNHDEVTDEEFETLKQRCVKAQEMAYCQYSNFKVGCSILTEEGVYVDGCNVENSSSGATICAERTAVVKAVSSGFLRFKAVAVSAITDEVITPCGICRQVLREFAHQEDLQLPIYLFNRDGSLYIKMFLEDLYPLSFGPRRFKSTSE